MKKEVRLVVVIAVIVVIAAIAGASYYRSSVQNVRVTSNTNTGQPAISPETLVRPDSPTLGPADAKVTIVEFLDPECEACAAFAPTVKRFLSQYEGKTRLVIRYMPFHPNSARAATMLELAGEQGKYWQAYDLLMTKQSEWGERHGAPPTQQPDVPKLFTGYAKELGLDPAAVEAAFKEGRYQQKLDRDRRDGQSVGVRQTPTFFVNGRRLLRFSESDLRALIEDELKR